ncbi:hypothetical protein CBS147322_8761 [Aspergillus niger]|nr:hypothetical protein CBS147322_8761 [Aspergillus niger]
MRSIILLGALIGLAMAAPSASIPTENGKREWLDGYGGGSGDRYGGGGGGDRYGQVKREWLDGYGGGGGDRYGGGGGGDGYGRA